MPTRSTGARRALIVVALLAGVAAAAPAPAVAQGRACPTIDAVKVNPGRFLSGISLVPHAGSATATFTQRVPDGCPGVPISLVSYSTDYPGFINPITQRLVDRETAVDGPLEVVLPTCMWQVDLIIGGEADVLPRFSPPDISYRARRQLLAARNGGADCGVPDNGPPTATPATLSTPLNQPVPAQLTGTDPDGDRLEFGLVGQPSHGSLSGTPPNLTYEPAPGYRGTDVFFFQVNDGRGSSEPAAVRVDVGEVNAPPRLRDDQATVAGNGSAAPPRPVCDQCGAIYGDPHLHGYDDAGIGFQGAGEYVATRSLDDDLEVQVRMTPVRGSRVVSIPTAVAMRVAGHRVAIYRTQEGADVKVDGDAVDVVPGARAIALPGGGELARHEDPDEFSVKWPDGAFVLARPHGIYPEFYRLLIQVQPAPGRARRLEGQLGSFDGVKDNDFVSRDGVQLELPNPSYEALYHTFGDSWRTSQAASLFDYEPDETTETFTDRTFPDRDVTADDLTAEQRARAEAVCDAFGVETPELRRGCLLDVGLTGDAEFAASAAAVEAEETEPPDVGVVLPGQPARIAFTEAGDALRSFAGTRGQRIAIEVTENTIPEVEIVLRGATGGVLSRTVVRSDSAFIDPITLTGTGSHTLEVHARGAGAITLGLVLVPDNAGTTAYDATTPIAITTPGEEAVRTFTAEAGDKVALDVSASTFADVSVHLRGPTGSVLAGGSVSTPAHSFDPVTLLASGTYSVTVDPPGASVGSLSVLLRRIPTNPGETDIGTPTTVSIATPGENATRTFTGRAGQLLSLNVTENTIRDVFVAVLGPTGSSITGSYVNPPGRWFDTFRLPADGTYTVSVDPYASNVGSLVFELAEVPENVGTTAIGEPTSVLMDTEGENATRTFTGTTGQLLTLDVSDSSLSDVYVAVLGPTGSSVTGSYVNPPGRWFDTFRLPATGTYTVSVDPYQRATGSLTFELAEVPENVGTTAIGESTSVAMDTEGENATRTFTGTAGQLLTLDVTDSSLSDVYVAVLGPTGSSVTGSWVNPPGRWFDTFRLPATGTYTVSVDPYQRATGGLTFELATVPANTGTTAVGQSTRVSVGTEGENATRTFTGTAGQQLTLDVTGSNIPDAFVAVLGPTGSAVTSSWVTPPGRRFAAFTLPVNGTYTVSVDPYQRQTGELTFLLSPATTVTGGALRLGRPLELEVSGRTIVRPFAARAGTDLTVMVSRNTLRGARFRIRAPSGRIVHRGRLSAPARFFDAVRLRQTGRYRLIVEPVARAAGRLTVLVDEVPRNVRRIRLGRTQTVTVTAPGQNPVRTFRARAGQRLRIRMRGTGLAPAAMRLRDQAAARVAALKVSPRHGSRVRASITQRIRRAGTHEVVLDPLGAQTGRAEITVELAGRRARPRARIAMPTSRPAQRHARPRAAPAPRRAAAVHTARARTGRAAAPVRRARTAAATKAAAGVPHTLTLRDADLLANDEPGPPDESDQQLTVKRVIASAATRGALERSDGGVITYTPADGFLGLARFEYEACDDGLSNGQPDPRCATATVVVDVTPNQRPVVVAQRAVTQEDTPVAVTVTGRDPEDDALGYGIERPAAYGLVSGAGPDFRYAPAQDFNGADSFRVVADDGQAFSAPTAVGISVSEVNDRPVARQNAVGARPGAALRLDPADLLRNDSPGPDNERDQALALTAATAGPDTHGTVTRDADGTVVYTADGGFTGAARFTYTACDDGTTDGAADPLCADGTVAVTVEPDAPPTAAPLTVTTRQDAPVEILLRGTDPEDGPLTYRTVSAPAHGALSGTAPELTYTPEAGFVGTDTFTYEVADDTTTSVPATVTVHVLSTAPPVARPDAATLTAGATASVDVLANDDAGAEPIDPATLRITRAPAGGTADVVASEIAYTPAAGTTSDSITYEVCDANAACTSADLTLTVLSGGPPATEPDSYALEMGSELAERAPGVLGNDPGRAGAHVRLASGVRAGRLLLQGTGAFAYTPDPSFTGTDSFSYVAVAPSGALSPPTTVSITVSRDGLIAADDTFTTTRDNPLTLGAPGVLENDIDTRPAGALAAGLERRPQHGEVTLSRDGALDYVPDPGFVGDDSFTYVIANAAGKRSAPARVGLTVTEPPGPQPQIGELSPADGARITKPTAITGSVEPPAGDAIARWTVTIRDVDGGTPQHLAGGEGPPPSSLATFDPTIVRNGTYEIRVQAVSEQGRTATRSITALVDGAMKLGDATASYADLTTTLGGVPIQVRRTYDTKDRRDGELGLGWRIELFGHRATPNGRLGHRGWSAAPSGFPFVQLRFSSSVAHFVTITSPYGDTEVFDLVPAASSPLLGLTQPTFVPRRGTGTTSQLEDVDSPTLALSGGSLRGFFTGELYDPRRFRLTTVDGTVLVIDRFLGLRSLTDRNGNELQVTSNGVRSTNGEGALDFTRDGAGRITEIEAPGDRRVAYEYAGVELRKFTAANGAENAFAYDTEHRLQRIDGPDGERLESLAYDADGRVVSITDAEGNTTRVRSDAPGRRLFVTSPSGRRTAVSTYDDAGLLVSEEQVFDGRSELTRFTYDAEDRLTSRTDALGNTTRTAYDENGNVTSETAANGSTRTTTYNALNLPTRVVDETGATLETRTYDSTGNVTSSTTADGVTREYGYDEAGFATSVRGPNGTVRVGYDGDARIASIVDEAGGRTDYEHDGAGNPNAVTDALGNTTRSTVNALDQTTSITNANGVVRRTGYDAHGRQVSSTDARGRVTRYDHDAAGRLIAVTDREGGVTRLAYDADGNVVRRTLPDGEEIVTTYDPMGRVLSLTDADTTVSYTYDAGGRVTSERSRGNGAAALPDVTLEYTYDAMGARTSVRGPGGDTSYGYDARSRPVSVTDAAGGAFTLTYDNADRLVSLSRPNGVTDTLEYGPSGRLASRRSQRASELLASTSYELDARLRPTTIEDTAGEHRYGYDALGRVVSATHPASSGLAAEAYTYDRVGNRSPAGAAAGSFAYDEADRLTSDDRYDYTYDAEGRLVRRVARASAAATTYAWNSLGQLTSVDGPGSRRSEYRYDALGRRVEANVDGRVTRYVYSGWDLHLEYDDANRLAAVHTLVGAEPGALLETARGGQRRYPLVDGLNSAVAMTDSGGEVIGRLGYSAFGVPSSTGSIEPAFTYTGHQYDEATGLYYARARYYDGDSGRFLSEDPLPAANPYVYADNAPTCFSDPYGLSATAEHHLVPQRAGFVAAARTRVIKCLGSIHDPRNIRTIPVSIHGGLHTFGYYAFVNALIGPTTPCSAVLKALTTLAWLSGAKK